MLWKTDKHRRESLFLELSCITPPWAAWEPPTKQFKQPVAPVKASLWFGNFKKTPALTHFSTLWFKPKLQSLLIHHRSHTPVLLLSYSQEERGEGVEGLGDAIHSLHPFLFPQMYRSLIPIYRTSFQLLFLFRGPAALPGRIQGGWRAVKTSTEVQSI